MPTNYQKIYEQLGYLFYAISAADKDVNPAEIQKLRDLVCQYWIPLEGTVDEYSTDAAHYILIVFDYLIAQRTSTAEAFDVFATYYRDHQAAFSSTIKHRISDTAGSIAHAFGKVNRAEHRTLAKLHGLLTDDVLVGLVHG